jgi:VWFA-related protein
MSRDLLLVFFGEVLDGAQTFMSSRLAVISGKARLRIPRSKVVILPHPDCVGNAQRGFPGLYLARLADLVGFMKALGIKALLSIGFGVTLTTAVGIAAHPLLAAPQNASQAPSEQSSSSGAATTLFKTTVRRLVLDVVVTDAAGKPVHGLTKDDFSIAEDGRPQKTLFFEANGFDRGMDYLPPKLPAEPVNTFVNLPKTPEKGPLYVLLYDLANMDNPDQQVSPGDFSIQMTARQQLVKFIEGKPEGARFCIFVWSDGLHLIQGFTSDKVQLMAAVDPHSPRPHLPQVFMMGQNSGANNVHETLRVLNYIAGYLNGLPGRKNLIWFSGAFPLTLFPSNDDSPVYIDQIKTTLDRIAQDQIAIYPVDARGVLVANPRAATGDTGGGGLSSDARDKGLSAPGGGSRTAAAAAASQGTTGGDGISLVAHSYMIQDEIARATGGRAFHSTNGVAGALLDATEDGSSYYTMTYSPSNQVYDGKLRKISVSLDKKGYQLAYRRAYYGSDTDVPIATPKSQASLPPPPRKPGDTLYANMEHGAPMAHQLIFGTHIHAVGSPAMGTAEQMAELATQPAYFKVRRKSAQPKALVPMRLQRYAVDYTVMAHQLLAASGGAVPSLEVAAAAYDSDGQMLNAIVNNATPEASNAATTQPQKAYRIQQEFDVPLTAASIRVAVRDTNTNRIGAMEIKLPLAPENESAAVPEVRN